jgi:hypothetical protein
MPATCSSCGTPIDVHQQVRGGTCNSIACRAVAAKRRLAVRNAASHAAAAAAALAHARRLLGSQASLDAVALVVVSGSNAKLRPIPTQRRENLRNNVAASIANSEHPHAEPTRCELPIASCPPASDALSAACATCRGFCCREGGDSAYLDANTLRRIRAERPALSPADLVELYAAAIPERSVEHSCIFHGEHGCTLPRELRSHTCNDYFCQPLREWLTWPVLQGAAVVVMDGEQVLRSTIID